MYLCLALSSGTHKEDLSWFLTLFCAWRDDFGTLLEPKEGGDN